VDVIPHTSTGGENLGWWITEGLECFNGGQCNTAGITMPVLDYGHNEGCAVMGGYIYRGSAIPALRGTYFCADFCSGWVRSFRWAAGAATGQTEDPGMLPAGEMPNSFGEDAAGEMYITTEGGSLYRIVAQWGRTDGRDGQAGGGLVGTVAESRPRPPLFRSVRLGRLSV
jgi:hypothetical protein